MVEKITSSLSELNLTRMRFVEKPPLCASWILASIEVDERSNSFTSEYCHFIKKSYQSNTTFLGAGDRSWSPRELRSSVSRGSESPPDSHSPPLLFKPCLGKLKNKKQTARVCFLLLMRVFTTKLIKS